MPGGHLATSIALSGVAYYASRSLELAAGCFAGGFLIDFDHYLDYLVFEKQWRNPAPSRFLSYYFNFQCRRVVLPLHSMELMAALTILAVFWPNLFLIGYLVGAAMHLALDVLVNGEYALKHAVLFYLFAYRTANGFSAQRLINFKPRTSSTKPFKDFFTWKHKLK